MIILILSKKKWRKLVSLATDLQAAVAQNTQAVADLTTRIKNLTPSGTGGSVSDTDVTAAIQGIAANSNAIGALLQPATPAAPAAPVAPIPNPLK